MANYDHYLTVPDRRSSLTEVVRSIQFTGVDHFRVHSPTLFGIPQVWKFISGRIAIACSADVANRVIVVTRYNNLFVAPMWWITRDAAIANESKQFYLQDGSWNASAASFNDSVLGMNGMALGVGNECYLDVYVYDGQPADVWYCHLEFEYLNRKWGMKEVLPEGID